MLVKTTLHSIDEFVPYKGSTDASGYARVVVDGERYPVYMTITLDQYENVKFPCVATLEVWPKLYNDKNGNAKPTFGVRFLSAVSL
jgi:hypothetical protein